MRKSFLFFFLSSFLFSSLISFEAGCGSGSSHEETDPTLPQAKDISAYPHSPTFSVPHYYTPRRLKVVPITSLGAPEGTMISALQGITAKRGSEMIYITEYRGVPWLDDLITNYGVVRDSTVLPMDALGQFKYLLSGYILYDSASNPDSVNVASSLASILNAVPVDKKLETGAKLTGLSMTQDVSGTNEQWLLENFGGELSKDFGFEQSEDKRTSLRDFVTLLGGAVVYGGTGRSGLVLDFLSGLNVGAKLFGWRGDEGEIESVEDYSLNASVFLPSDNAQNLSVLSQVETPPLKQPNHTLSVETVDGVHYVALVLSDGDNLSFVLNDLASSTLFGHPARGTFPMNWEMTPSMSVVAPSVLAWFYRNATSSDQFVSGSSGHGYIFPNMYPDQGGFLDELGYMLEKSDMRIVTVIDTVSIAALDPYLDIPQVSGVIYKTGSYYSGLGGEIRIHNGKPIVSVKLSIWEGSKTPQEAADAINNLPRNPTSVMSSYSVVMVHPFSTFGGDQRIFSAMESASQFVSSLNPSVKVVTAEDLITLVSQNFGG